MRNFSSLRMLSFLALALSLATVTPSAAQTAEPTAAGLPERRDADLEGGAVPGDGLPGDAVALRREAHRQGQRDGRSTGDVLGARGAQPTGVRQTNRLVDLGLERRQ